MSAEPNDERADRTHIDVVMFSGGSGTDSITTALVRHPQIRLRVVINAYDDGHSTGRLRMFIPSMLGPSDVRKNINRLMPTNERCQRSLKALSDYRLPVDISQADALNLIDALIAGDQRRMPAPIAGQFRWLSMTQASWFRDLLAVFLQYHRKQSTAGRSFDFHDCALGNLVFAGCFLQEDAEFNRTIDRLAELYEVPRGTILNITAGENLFLVAAKEDGSILTREADIVAAQSAVKISDLYLIDAQLYRTRIEGAPPPPGGWQPLLSASTITPRINPDAARAISDANVIIYGPGTQHSSLYPSYMTEGVAESIAANRTADKILIGNIARDYDIQADDVSDLSRKFMHAMSRKGQVSVQWRDCVSHYFVQGTEEHTRDDSRYIPFHPETFTYPLETVHVGDWEAHGGRHAGGLILGEVQQIVQSRIDIELQRVQHMVSIVVPVLNEARTLNQVLRSLSALDFHPWGMTKEIIVVDGGSDDHSRDIARSIPAVRLYELARGKGCGAALRLGIAKARGSIVAFFPSDLEYRAEDLYALIAPLTESRYRAVFGTRAVKVRDLSQELRAIYANNRLLYLTSKYGGMLLSILSLLLYNRYITDVLTSMKAFDALTLRSLELESDGRDLDAEIFAKLSLRREFILELPVDYHPRTRQQGKTITLNDGVKALTALWRYRIARRGRGGEATASDIRRPAPAAVAGQSAAVPENASVVSAGGQRATSH